MSSEDFIREFNGMSLEVERVAKAHGWRQTQRNEAELIALMHSELSEALESIRHGNPPSDHIPGFTGVEEEFADVIIRVMDHATARGYMVAEALVAKVAFNGKREFMHGGKRF